MKYIELQEAFNNKRDKWNNYQSELVNSFSKIINSFIAYLDIQEPNRLIKLTPIDRSKSKDGSNYTVMGAMNFEDNGWASLGLILTLERSKNSYQKTDYIFNFFLKKKDSIWLIKGFRDGPEIELSSDINEDSLNTFNDHISESFHKSITRGVDEWLMESENHLIGFYQEDK